MASERRTERIPVKSEIAFFRDMNIDAHVQMRAGIFPVYIRSGEAMNDEKNRESSETGEIRVILGKDKRSKLLTNLAGHINQRNESLAEGIKRECKEESLELLILDDEKLKNSVTVFSAYQVVVFYYLSESEALDLVKKHAEEVKKRVNVEIDDLKDMSWNEFWKVITYDKRPELIFRPVSMLLSETKDLYEIVTGKKKPLYRPPSFPGRRRAASSETLSGAAGTVRIAPGNPVVKRASRSASPIRGASKGLKTLVDSSNYDKNEN